MTIGERIKQLRKCLDLTQKEFAERISIKHNTLSQYEIGRSNPTDALINLVCREYGVSEKWLRSGEGDMFVQPSVEDEMLDLARRVGIEEDFRRRLITALIRLSKDELARAEQFVNELVREEAPHEPTIDEKVAAYRHLLEEEEKGGEESEVS